MNAFSDGDEVVVASTDRMVELGVAGWRGRVVGGSYEDDDWPSGRIISYAVELGPPGDARVYMIDPDDLRAAT